MAPRSETTMNDTVNTGDFFSTVDPRGYPDNKEKARPWMHLIAAKQEKLRKPAEVDKMVVVCSLQHDHGTSSLGGY